MVPKNLELRTPTIFDSFTLSFHLILFIMPCKVVCNVLVSIVCLFSCLLQLVALIVIVEQFYKPNSQKGNQIGLGLFSKYLQLCFCDGTFFVIHTNICMLSIQ